jgi:transcriptional regulator with AAA-type ATPase domain
MFERWIGLLGALRERTHFEDGAALFLRAVMDTAATVTVRPGALGGRILRAMIHDRPPVGYRRLAVMDFAAADVTTTGLKEAFLPSATAWRWIVENRRPASIDVNLALIQTEGPGGPEATTDPGLLNTGVTTDESRLRLLRRGATHVYVLPLLGPRGSVDGLVSIEAHSAAAVGQSFGWSDCAQELELLTALGAPFLTELPLRPSPGPWTDPLLPVAGASMAALVRVLRVFREQRETVLIAGPTGCGKSRLARWCHQTSGRSGGPFEVLDLSSVPEELQMGELFGWRKGAFTGALRDNPGALGRAEGGTLFIDEVDKLSLRAQAGLLHVLEERGYRPLGDTGGEQSADVRFIVGTNANLLDAVRHKRLREDLYYRINVLPVQIPPLVERRDEIVPWAAFMVQRRHQESVPDGRAELTPEATALLVHEPWPGNLRQLDNIVRRAYALAVTELGGLPQRAITIGEEHLRRSLAYESQDPEARVLPAIQGAAAAFLAEARRRWNDGTPLDLDLADAFKGFVLAAALEEDRDRDRVFQLFGKDALVKSRNHHKVLRRELERVEVLSQIMAGSAQTPVSRFLEVDEVAAESSED